MYEAATITSMDREVPIVGSNTEDDDNETVNLFQNRLENCKVIPKDSLKEFIEYKNVKSISMAICNFDHCLIKMLINDTSSIEPQEYVVYQYKDSKELESWCKILNTRLDYNDLIDFLEHRKNEIISSRYLINQLSIIKQIPLRQNCTSFIPERIKICIPLVSEGRFIHEIDFEIHTFWPKSSNERLKIIVTCRKLDGYRSEAMAKEVKQLETELSNQFGFINLTQQLS